MLASKLKVQKKTLKTQSSVSKDDDDDFSINFVKKRREINTVNSSISATEDNISISRLGFNTFSLGQPPLSYTDINSVTRLGHFRNVMVDKNLLQNYREENNLYSASDQKP